MNNKLRIKRIKAGIKMLEKGICPSDNFNTVGEFEKYYGVNISGCLLLVTNQECIVDEWLLMMCLFAKTFNVN
jgi:hypothetical protein